MDFGLLGFGSNASVGGYDPAAEAYFNSLPTAITDVRKNAINALILALKESKNGSNQSIWDLTDKFHILANASIENAAINAKYPTKTTDADGLGTLDYQGVSPTCPNGAGLLTDSAGTSHIYTRYRPDGTNNYKKDSATAVVWILLADEEKKYSLADNNSALFFVPRVNATMAYVGINGGKATSPYLPVSGFFGATRNGSASFTHRSNENAGDIAVTSSALPNSIIALAGLYNFTSNYSQSIHPFLFIGGGLTTGVGGQFEALYLAMKQYLVTMGVISS